MVYELPSGYVYTYVFKSSNFAKVTNSIDLREAIAGYMNDGNAIVQNCYTTGAVSANSNACAAVGLCSSGKVNNCFALAGLPAEAEVTKFKEEAYMKSAAFLNDLGEGFIGDKENRNNGYPICPFQYQEATYDAIFTISPGDAVIKVTNEQGKEMAVVVTSEHDAKIYTYRLPSGTYQYNIAKFGNIGQTAGFIISEASF